MVLRELRADTYRIYSAFKWRYLLLGAIRRRPFRTIVTLRLCQASARSCGVMRALLFVFRAMHRLASGSAGIDLVWTTQIGGGLAIVHGWGLVVSPRVQIGRNVTLFHGVTLGQRDRIAKDGTLLSEYPVIEDDVWIGPHAIIVGGVSIGRGSRVAGGAFVTTCVPPYSLVVGNPAHVVKSNCMPDVGNRAPL